MINLTTPMKCQYPNPDPHTAALVPRLTREIEPPMRLFYPNCAKVNLLCQAGSPAYLSGVTICAQRIW